MIVYTPWWLYKEQLAGQLDFARGYHIEIGGGRRAPGMGPYLPDSTSFGSQLKKDARR